ncbi:CcdC family protein [Virgibacillus sp. FSP13]
MFWIIASTVVAACMATLMIFVRLKAAKKPASVKKIILPPVFMSTGALMFVVPALRVPWAQVLEAFIVGMIFSIFLIKSSKFEIKEDDIYLIPSKSFVFILFGLLAVRIIIKLVIGSTISLGETSGMFFLLAFGMILTWRLAMLYKYKKLERQLKYRNA